MSAGLVIREARLPEDEPLFVRFIDGLQAFEHEFEPDRRVDVRAGLDYLPVLLDRVRKHQGRIFVAEWGAAPVGWGVFHTGENSVYIVEHERRYGYIAELFVEERMRGRGIGRALIDACETVGRDIGLKLMMIGVLSKNTRARTSYEAAGFAPYAMELRKYL